MATLSAGLAAGGGWAGQAGLLRPGGQLMSGEDIYRCLMFDEWWVAAHDRQGHIFNLEIFPNGRFQAANLSGGGSVVGEWQVDQPANRLCLSWDRRADVADGCYEMRRTGPLTYELVDSPSRITTWWFVVSDEVR